MEYLTDRERQRAEWIRRRKQTAKEAVRIMKELGRWIEGYQVHHLDGNPFNNDPDNLIMLHPKIHAKITRRQMRTEKFRIKRRHPWLT